ncbi:MAG: putative manganese-dependent inorganic diphosphatase, partial [Puniceicoccales bacterium]
FFFFAKLPFSQFPNCITHELMPKPVYIFGHKNPDADAICSAIGYAAFKEATGEKGFLPARCGNSNARIDAILDRFKVPLPTFIGDVTPRLGDIMKTEFWKASPQSTCAEALQLIDEYDVRSLPVVDEEGKAKGLVSIFDLGEYFTPRISNPIRMRMVRSTITAIARSLKAKTIHLHEPDRLEELFVRIGAMDIRSFGNFARKEVSPRESIIVVGDRWDIQEKSMQLGVRLLVITGNLELDPEMIERAKEKDVSLIISPYDSATTSWIIRSASFLDNLFETETIQFHREERVRDVQKRIARKYAPLYMVTDSNDRLLGIFSKTDIFKPPTTQIVLVDHNELSQAVPGASEVEILEIIDHHRLGNIPTDQPILFINRPVGSTCTIVADRFFKEGLEPSPAIAGILMAGLISDTLLLSSPTTTPTDKEILERLAKIADVDPKELAESIFTSGSVILNSQPAQVIQMDCKVYGEENTRFSVSQVEELGFDNFWEHENALKKALEEYRETENLNFSALLVTDINTQNSLLVVTGEEQLIAGISYPSVTSGEIFDLKGIVSRKKQLIPYLSKLFADS